MGYLNAFILLCCIDLAVRDNKYPVHWFTLVIKVLAVWYAVSVLATLGS